MFFFFSKMFYFMLDPLVWFLITLLLAVATKNIVRKKKLGVLSLLLLLFFSNSFLVDEALRKWEVAAIKIDQPAQYDYAIVLSGMTIWDKEFERINFQENADRLLQVLPLVENGVVDSLIISGGDGTVFQNEVKEADALLRYLKSINFDTKKILIEKDSRNTQENAAFTNRNLLKDGVRLQNKKVLLITSASHMRRSLGCFAKHGITCTAYCTNRISGPRKFTFDHLLIPNTRAIDSWRILFQELAGYSVYWVMNYL